MFSLVIGILWGALVIFLAFSPAIKNDNFPFQLAIALAGIGLIFKTILIFTLSGGI